MPKTTETEDDAKYGGPVVIEQRRTPAEMNALVAKLLAESKPPK